MGAITFFTPVSYDKYPEKTWLQQIEEKNDAYLSFGNTCAYVIPQEQDSHVLNVKIKKTRPHQYQTISNALKVASYVVFFFPAIILKVIFRTFHAYQIKKVHIPFYDGPDRLSGLAEELQMHILSFLRGKELARTASASSHFYKLIHDPLLQERVNYEELLLNAKEGLIKYNDVLQCYVEADKKGFVLELKETAIAAIISSELDESKKIDAFIKLTNILAGNPRYYGEAESILASIDFQGLERASIPYKTAKVARAYLKIDKVECVEKLIQGLEEEKLSDILRLEILKFFLSRGDASKARRIKGQIVVEEYLQKAQKKLDKFAAKEAKTQKEKAKEREQTRNLVWLDQVSDKSFVKKFVQAERLCQKISDPAIRANALVRIAEQKINKSRREGMQLIQAAKEHLDQISLKSQIRLHLAIASVFQGVDEELMINEIRDAKAEIKKEEDIFLKVHFLFDLAKFQRSFQESDLKETLDEIKTYMYLEHLFDHARMIRRLIEFMPSEEATIMHEFKAFLRRPELTKTIHNNPFDTQLNIGDVEGAQKTLKLLEEKYFPRDTWYFWALCGLHVNLYKAVPDKEKEEFFTLTANPLRIGALILLSERGKHNNFLIQARILARKVSDLKMRGLLLDACSRTQLKSGVV